MVLLLFCKKSALLLVEILLLINWNEYIMIKD